LTFEIEPPKVVSLPSLFPKNKSFPESVSRVPVGVEFLVNVVLVPLIYNTGLLLVDEELYINVISDQVCNGITTADVQNPSVPSK